NGCPFLTTPVTTGRPALPTDRGTFHIFAKYPSYHMISPWPPGSPFWYHDAWVYNAMEFVSDGTFIHNAGWQPADTYGPGSQYGPYASHGCVHVPDGPLARLYAWAAIGTTVTVIDDTLSATSPCNHADAAPAAHPACAHHDRYREHRGVRDARPHPGPELADCAGGGRAGRRARNRQKPGVRPAQPARRHSPLPGGLWRRHLRPLPTA